MGITSLLPLSFRQYWGRKFKENKIVSKITAERNYSKLSERLDTLSSECPVDLDRFNIKVFSQAGEDGVLACLMKLIKPRSNFCVEFGVEDASECNTRLLIEKYKWRYLHMDGSFYKDAKTDIKTEFITAVNINLLFDKYNVPADLDILCVDIDYSTYYVLEALDEKYKASVVVVEYNASLGPSEVKVVKRQDDRMWDGTMYFGASLKAITNLLNKRDYSLVYCDQYGISAFYVLNSVLSNIKIPNVNNIDKIYREPRYGQRNGNTYLGHPPARDGDNFITI